MTSWLAKACLKAGLESPSLWRDLVLPERMPQMARKKRPTRRQLQRRAATMRWYWKRAERFEVEGKTTMGKARTYRLWNTCLHGKDRRNWVLRQKTAELNAGGLSRRGNKLRPTLSDFERQWNEFKNECKT